MQWQPLLAISSNDHGGGGGKGYCIKKMPHRMSFRCIHASYSNKSEISMTLTQVPIIKTVTRMIRISAASKAFAVWRNMN